MVDAPNPNSFTISKSFTILYKHPRENNAFLLNPCYALSFKSNMSPKTKEWKKIILHFEGN